MCWHNRGSPRWERLEQWAWSIGCWDWCTHKPFGKHVEFGGVSDDGQVQTCLSASEALRELHAISSHLLLSFPGSLSHSFPHTQSTAGAPPSVARAPPACLSTALFHLDPAPSGWNAHASHPWFVLGRGFWLPMRFCISHELPSDTRAAGPGPRGGMMKELAQGWQTGE